MNLRKKHFDCQRLGRNCVAVQKKSQTANTFSLSCLGIQDFTIKKQSEKFSSMI